MTTTNDGGAAVPPMVIKATAVINAAIAKHSGESPELVASLLGEFHQDLAFELLTECGALECLEALRKAKNDMLDLASSEDNLAPAIQSIDEAIAKATAVEVYGSAPE
jgi:hypothetical protein